MYPEDEKKVVVNVKTPSHWFQSCLAVIGGVAILFFVCLIGLCVLLGGCFASTINSVQDEIEVHTGGIDMKYLSGNESADRYIAVIDIKGVITSDDISLGDNCAKDDIIKKIRAASEDSNAVAILLNLDTPGGEVTAADEIYHELTLVKKPIVSMMNSMAASGGYYIAAASKKIIANKLTTTGSIGVVMHTYNISQLMNRLSVEQVSYASGKMKTMLDPMQPINKEADPIVMQMIQNSYQVFVNIVAESRGIPADTIKNGPIGDGRVMDGPQALSYHLVDELGYFADAVKATAKLAGLKEGEYYVAKVKTPTDLSALLTEILAESRISPLSAVFSGRAEAHLKPGRLYYLPSFF